MEKGYSKKIFTAKMFFADFGFLIWHLPQLVKVFTNKKIEKLIGKILIVTDAVNECMYCSWLDAKLAIKNGISEEEVKNMMNLEFQTSVSNYEWPALIFAQDFAENNRKADVEMLKTLTSHYGEKTTKDILLAIRAVIFGNLYFNTWGAFLSRLKGKPAPNSNLIFELVYFICNFVIIIPFVVLRKLDRNAIGLSGKNGD